MKRLVALLMLLAGVLAACSSGGAATTSPSGLDPNQNTGGTYDGVGLTPAQPRPSFTLTDTEGKKFQFGTTTTGHPTLLYFGYTHCPDVCPETMASVGAALRTLPASLASQTYVVFVTTDIKRDTAPVISSWLANFSAGTQGAHFVGLRGTQAEIDAAQASAHVAVAEDHGETHASELLLYGTDNYARVAFLPTGKEAMSIEHDLPLVSGQA